MKALRIDQIFNNHCMSIDHDQSIEIIAITYILDFAYLMYG